MLVVRVLLEMVLLEEEAVMPMLFVLSVNLFCVMVLRDD